MPDGRVIIDTRLDTSGLESGIKTIKNILTGGAVTAGFATLKKIVADISQETESLNDSVRAASQLFQGYDVDIGNLTQRLEELSGVTNTAASDLGQGLYAALSAGIPASDDMGEALSFVEKNARAAQAGFAGLEDTINASASVLNAYGMSVSETDRVLGILMQTQNLGITTIGKLSTSLAQVVPTAAAFGVSFEQIGAALATMTAAGTQTSQATTSLNAMLSELGKQGQTAYDNLVDAAESAGLGRKNFQQLTEEGYNLGEILSLMSDYAEKNGKNLIDMFGSVEAGRGAMQLANNEAESFTSSLADMANTEGLIDNAFNAVVTNTDRLRLAFKNAKTTIGNVFAPAWDEIAGKLADGINSLTGNKDAAGELDTAFNNLVSAMDNYKKAQENAKGATDETTESMIRQAGEAQHQAIIEFSNAYKNAMDSMRDNSREIGQAENVIDDMETKLQDLADQAGMTASEMEALYNAGRLSDAYVSDYEKYTNEIEYQKDKINDLSGGISELEKAYDGVITKATLFYVDGKISMDELSAASADVARDVRRLARAYEAGAASEQNFLEADNFKEFAESEISRLQDLQSSVEEGTVAWFKYAGAIDAVAKAAEIDLSPKSDSSQSNSGTAPIIDEEAVKKAQEKLEKALASSKAELTLFGDAASYVESSISALETGIQELISAGVTPMDQRVQDLSEQLKNFQKRLKEVSKGEGLKDVMANWNKTLGNNIKLSEIFEDDSSLSSIFGDFDLIEEQIEATKSAINSLVLDYGFDADSAQVKTLVGVLKDLEKQSKSTSKTLENMGEAAKEAFSADNIANLITDSFRSLGDTIAGAGERIAELNEETLEYDDMLLEAQKELADAKARGDKEAIKNLEEQIEEYNEIIKANNNEKKALESGEEAWKEFARTGLNALAEILYGLGAQLAAQAISTYPNFAQMALAAAGSVAAIAAAAGLQVAAGSFEEGGIVPSVAGVPTTGDHLTARVNPGELILNKAQQDNLSSYLVAMEAQRGLSSPSSGPSIVVNMQGAYIYGLDEPAVGRAIYDNIRTLQSEGVLR